MGHIIYLFIIIACCIILFFLYKKSKILFVILLIISLLIFFCSPALYTIYMLEKNQPQIETLYDATKKQDLSGRLIYEIPDTFRHDYFHLDLDITAQNTKEMGCSIDYYLRDGKRYSFSFKQSSSLYQFSIPYDHIKTIQRIEISNIENILDITLRNTYVNL